MGMVPLIAPDGSSGEVPAGKAQAAIQAGGKPAVWIKAPDGTPGLVPKENALAAIKAGGKPYGSLSALQQDSQVKTDSGPQGLLANVGSYVKGMLPGSLKEYAQQEAGILIPGASQVMQAYQAAKAAKQQGIGTAAKNLAGATVGVNVPAVEQRAAQGDTAGVLGQLAIPAAMAAAPLLKEGAGKLSEGAQAIKETPPVQKAIETGKEAARKLASVTPVAKMFVDGPPEQLLTQAIKPGKNNVDWQPSLKSAIPNMKLAEEALGKPIQGIDDALQATQLAKKQLWQQYAPKLQAADAAGATIDGNVVADAMVDSIDKRTAVQNPGLVEKVKTIADTYRKPIPVTEAEDFLVSANRDLNSYYAKNKVGRRVAEGDPSVSSTVAEADALRDGLYSKLDEVTGPGAADFKKQYGALTNVEKELQGRKNVSERQQPVSLAEQLSTARAYGKIAKGMLTISPGDVLEGTESVAVAKWLKERQTADAMITRAFEAAKKPQPPAFNLTPPAGPAPAAPQQLPLPQQPLPRNFAPQGNTAQRFPQRPILPAGWKYDSFGRPVRETQ